MQEGIVDPSLPSKNTDSFGGQIEIFPDLIASLGCAGSQATAPENHMLQADYVVLHVVRCL